MAFQAGAIVSQMTMDRSKFSASMKVVQKETRALGGWVKKNSGQIKRMGLAIAAAGAGAIAVFAKMTKQYIEAGDVIDKMSKRTGFAATTLSELAYAADISGADINMLEKGVKRMARTITDAGEGLESYLRPLRRIGLEVKDLQAMKPEDQFLRISEGIAKLEDSTLRAATAQEIFGRAGTMLLPLMAEGAEGLQRLREEAHELGIIYDEEAAAKAAELKDAQTALKGSIQGLSIAILSDLVPVITGLVKQFTEWFKGSREHAATWTKALLGAFQFIAQGIQGLLLAWHGLKTGVFTVAEAITKSLTSIAKGLLWIAKLTPGTEIFYAEKLENLIRDLTAISEGYREEKDKGIDTMTDIIEKYEAFVATLNKVKTGTKGTKEETKSFSETLTDSALPAARKLGDVMDKAVTEMESGAYRVRKSWEETFWKILSDAMLFTSSLSGLFSQLTQNQIMNIENEYQARKKAIENSLMTEKSKTDAMERLDKEFEKRRIKAMRAQAIRTKIVGIMESIINTASAIAEALPNIPLAIAVGIMGAAQTALIAAQPLPSFQRGGRIEEAGIVGEKGPELFTPGKPGEIIPLREKASPLGLRAILTFSPSFYLTSLDPQTARDVVRNQVGPELLEMFRTKILLPEFQDALRIK